MNVAIILAAGKSSRAGKDKLMASINRIPLWFYSYRTFLDHPEIDKIILVVSNKSNFKNYIGEKTEQVIGGETRMESFKNAMATFNFKDTDIIIDHNAANPSVTKKEISAVIRDAKKYGAAAVSLPCVDTLISAKNGFYTETLDRNTIRLMQTPQAVRGDILKKVVLENQSDLTSAILSFHKVRLLEANLKNKKITFVEDLQALQSNSFIGEDSHEFSKSGILTLGGLKIKSMPSLKANSDGDVVLHALGRALAQCKNLSFSVIADELCESGERNSAAYLKPLLKDIEILMLSISLECEKPKIDNLPIKQSLAKILKIPEEKIRISAHSGEGANPNHIRCSLILNCICK